MRRLLIGTWAYFADLTRSIRSGWDRFVFRPADPTPLGVVRVAVGLLAFWSVFVYGLDLRAYLGPEGWANYETVEAIRGDESTAWSFWPLVPPALLRPAWVACLAVLGLFTVGLWSRATAVLAWAIVVSTSRRAPETVFGFDQMVSTWIFYLAASGASGRAVSLDRFLERLRRNRFELRVRLKSGRWSPARGVPEPSIAANIGLRLIQCHLALIYGVAALAKFRGNAWWVGDSFWSVVAAEEFRVFDLGWLAAYPSLIQFCTHAGLAIELAYPVLIWVRPARPLILGLIVLMHATIALTLGLWEFSLAMIAGNMAFVSGPWLRSLVAGRTPGAVSGRVLYDGACPKCRASMAALTAGDPDRLIEPVDLTAVEPAEVHPSLGREACLKAMHLARSDGRVEVGYDAVMTLLAWTPLFWPFSLVRYVPGISPVGRRVYNRIAATRARDVCDDEVCGIHPPRSHAAPASPGRTAR